MEHDYNYDLKGIAMPGQAWLGHLNFPGYLVGVHGEVASFLKKPKILSPIRLGEYDGFQLRNAEGKTVKVYRHRLVAEVIHGPCPEGMECRHKDGNKKNADFTNLAWGTKLENTNDKFLHGTMARGEGIGVSKLTEREVVEMRKLRSDGMIFRDIAKIFNVSTMTAYRAVSRISWRHING